MKWVDYREKLGIGFHDDAKFKMLLNMLQNYVENCLGECCDEVSHLNYCQMVGEPNYDVYRPYQHLSQSLAIQKKDDGDYLVFTAVLFLI